MTDDLHDLLTGLVEPLPPVTALQDAVLARGARRRRAKLLGTSASAVAVVGAGVLLALPSPAPMPRVVLGTVPSASPSPSTPSPTSSPAAGRVVLVLEPDGLGYVAGPSSIRHLSFAGADAASAEDLAVRALGPGTTTALPDCGPAVRVVDHGGFSLYLQGTRFVGWSDRGRTGLRTADGVGLGTTLAELRTAFGSVTVTTGTVGPEWSTAGGLAGGLDGTAPTSKVVRVGAGSTCVAR